jgi:hypothetical protein
VPTENKHDLVFNGLFNRIFLACVQPYVERNAFGSKVNSNRCIDVERDCIPATELRQKFGDVIRRAILTPRIASSENVTRRVAVGRRLMDQR